MDINANEKLFGKYCTKLSVALFSHCARAKPTIPSNTEFTLGFDYGRIITQLSLEWVHIIVIKL